MSSKKKVKTEAKEDIPTRIPLMQRPRFNLFYTMMVIVLFSAGIILLILSYSIFSDIPSLLFVSLGVLGLGIILLTMRSSYKKTAPSVEEEEEAKTDDSLRMRNR
ncbi:MAG: hypothetical protein KAS63_05570 [Candidatus Heimdallarchaeota archaeon]|nr:hypothetical protein [Candidatus Heimdallarchaeota archaeon]MCK4954807.1 hypothetical protein [Candidatus Heimdallarchaeota archaeon]